MPPSSKKNDGKWYICDHSSNGTSVNGVTIPKNQDFPITKRDEIKCAGETVLNPISGGRGNRKPIGAILAGISVAAVIAIGVVAYFLLSLDGCPDLQNLCSGNSSNRHHVLLQVVASGNGNGPLCPR